jgi:hypothetical protein
LAAQGINLYLPVLDRWPPLAYPLGDWIPSDNTPDPAPDVIPHHPEDNMPDVPLDAGARDELDHQQNTFHSHILTLDALPLSVGQRPL